MEGGHSPAKAAARHRPGRLARFNASNMHPLIAAQMGLPIDEPEGMMGPAANQMAEASLSVLEGAVAIGEVLAGGVNSQEDEDMGSGHRKSTSTTIGLTSDSEEEAEEGEITAHASQHTPSPHPAGLGGSKLPSFFPSTRAESPPAGRWHHAPQHGRGHSRRGGGGRNRRKPRKPSRMGGVVKHAKHAIRMGLLLANEFTNSLLRTDREEDAAPATGNSGAQDSPTTSGGSDGEVEEVVPVPEGVPDGVPDVTVVAETAGDTHMPLASNWDKGTGVFAGECDGEVVDLT